MRLGLDLDDVTFKYMKEFERRLYSKNILPLPSDNFSTYELIHNGIDLRKYVNIEAQNNIYKDLEVYDNCVEVLQEFSKNNEIVIITKRLFEKPYKTIVNDTMYCLEKHNIPFNEIHFLEPHEHKSDVICDVYIDDSPSNIQDILSINKRAYLFDKSYNKNFNYKYRVHDWLEIKEVLSG